MSSALIGVHALASDEGFWISDSSGCKVVLNPKPEPSVTVTWTGACPDGFARGEGILQWIVDGKKEVEFNITTVNGKAEGEGTSVTAGELRYQGNFVDGKMSGKGVMTWPNGDRYEGDWIANKRDGKGVQVFADGSRYEGEWKADKKEGVGEQTWPDGSHYKGLFADNKPAHPELIDSKTYVVHENVTGSHIARDSIGGELVPDYKSYADLSAKEKNRVKSEFGLTAEADEPPYPRNGPHHILEELQSIEAKLQVSGILSLAVTVDATGNPIAVDVSESPDKRMTYAITEVLLRENYKPAQCNATPCQKQYPLVVNVRSE
jgi:hypothetical protein